MRIRPAPPHPVLVRNGPDFATLGAEGHGPPHSCHVDCRVHRTSSIPTRCLGCMTLRTALARLTEAKGCQGLMHASFRSFPTVRRCCAICPTDSIERLDGWRHELTADLGSNAKEWKQTTDQCAASGGKCFMRPVTRKGTGVHRSGGRQQAGSDRERWAASQPPRSFRSSQVRLGGDRV